MEGFQKVTQEQSEKLLILQKEVEEREEELVVTRKEMSDLQHKLAQVSDNLNAETACKQTMEHDLERMINTLQAYVETESSDANNFMQQLKIEHLSMKQELASYEKEMMEKLNVKELALAKLREELIVKQNSLDVIVCVDIQLNWRNGKNKVKNNQTRF